MFWKYLCMILLTEIQDPLMTILLYQYVNHDCACKMEIKPRHCILNVDCEVTIFTRRSSKYHGTFAMFYKLDSPTLAITNITDRLSWASALSDPNIIYRRKFDYKRWITLADLLESNVKIIFSSLKCTVSLCFLLGFENV